MREWVNISNDATYYVEVETGRVIAQVTLDGGLWEASGHSIDTERYISRAKAIVAIEKAMKAVDDLFAAKDVIADARFRGGDQ